MKGQILNVCESTVPALGLDVCAAFEKQPKGLLFTKPDFKVPAGTEDVGAYIRKYALPYQFSVDGTSEGLRLVKGIDVPPAVFPLLEGLTNLEPTGGDVRISQEGFGSGVVNGHENYQEVYTFLRGGMCLFKQLSKMEGQDLRVFFVDESNVAYGVMGKDGSIRGFLANIGVNYRKNVGTTPAAIMVTLVYATSYTEDFKNVTAFDIPEDLRSVRQVEAEVYDVTLDAGTLTYKVKWVTSCARTNITALLSGVAGIKELHMIHIPETGTDKEASTSTFTVDHIAVELLTSGITESQTLTLVPSFETNADAVDFTDNHLRIDLVDANFEVTV